VARPARSQWLSDAGRANALEPEPAVDAGDVDVLGLDEDQLGPALARVLHEPRGHERGQAAAAGAGQRGDADVARIYGRLGFERVGTACIAEPL